MTHHIQPRPLSIVLRHCGHSTSNQVVQGYLRKSPFSFKTKPGQGNFQFRLVFITTGLKIQVSVSLVINPTNVVGNIVLLSTNFMDYQEKVEFADPVEKLTLKLLHFKSLGF